MDSIIPLGQKNTLAEYMILAGADNRPPMLDKYLYNSWKSRMELYMQNREHDNPLPVYKLKKALYGLKQAPRAWYDMPSSFLISQHFSKGAVDPTLFTRLRGIFINQSKYAYEIVKKYGLLTTDSVDTPLVEKSKLDEDLQGKPVDATLYHGMIGSLMYLTSSRPNLIYAVCLCARSIRSLCTATNKSGLLYAATMFNIQELSIIDIRYHFIKEQVENWNRGAIDFVSRTKYQPADIFTKLLSRERFNFLIDKLGMKSMSPETLKRLAEETDE
ncbi:retrovirus-related pol polyprotein from transposon TNT 1-94 [Tanacetum coccineum]